jgi:GNAT superfamily N-acetyltransferase
MSDFDNCIRLLKLGHTNDFDSKRFEWLHVKNALAPSRIAVAEHEGAIIGVYAVIKKNVLFNGIKYIAGRDIDPVVHPDFRGKGIFSQLIDYGFNSFHEIDFFFNFANDLSKTGFLNKGWREIGRLKDYIYQVGYDNQYSFQFCLYWICRINYSATNRDNFCELSLDKITDNLDGLSCFSSNRFCVQRDIEYIRWRYDMHPFNTYKYIVALDKNEVTKIAIVRIDPDNNEIILCDFLYRDKSDASIDFLVSFLRNSGLLYKIKMWHSYPDVVRRQFITNPFKRKQTGQIFLVKSFPGKEIPDGLYDIGKWIVTYGDAEIM